MHAAIQGTGYPILNLVGAAPPSEDEGFPSPLTAVPEYPGWWYAVPAGQQSGGVWNRHRDRRSRVLPWCPQVVVKAGAVDAAGVCRRQYYVVRVDRQLALLSDSDLSDGKGWQHFTTIDLWQTLRLKSLLANVVQDQAQQLPQIVFRDAT